MRTRTQSRATKRAGVVALLTMVVLALVPMAPAAAVQTISWTTSPPATATVGQQVSFAWSGTANTFLGARVTGCFANFPDGNNYTNAFGGNFTTGSCQYTNRAMTVPGNYQITVGFTLSTGSSMTQTWNVNVAAPTPTLAVPSDITTEATSVQGATVSFETTASDSYYGTYGTSCTPASGSVFPVGTSTVSCTATNPGGRTGAASFAVTVSKTSPTLLWAPPSTLTYGATYDDVMTAEMQAADATGTITYEQIDGTAFSGDAVVPVGADQIIKATYTPLGPAASAYHPVAAERTISVEKASSTVAFDDETPTTTQYGDAPFTVDVTGTSGSGDVTVSTQTDSVCTVNSPSAGTTVSATVTLTRAGDCVLLADQAGTDNYTAAPTAQWSVTSSKGNPEITWSPPASLTYGDSVSDVFNATADLPGTMTYLVNGVELPPATVLDAGAERSVSATFTPDQTDDYTEATAARTFIVNQAEQTVTVGGIDDKTFGSEPFDLDIGGAGPGTVSASAAGLCTIDDLEVTVVGAGECAVTVSKAGTSNYLAAPSVTRTFTIDPALQTLTVGQIADHTYGEAPFTLDIGGAGPGTISTAATGACAVAGSTVTLERAGDCTVTVDKAATSNYLAAPQATRTFTIKPAVVIAGPKVSKLSPSSGPTQGKTPITITGSGFAAATSVKFGAVAARFTIKNSTTIVVTTPALKQGAYDIRVTTPNGTSAPIAASRYTVRPVPKIAKLSAISGRSAGKKSLTIRGSGFIGSTSVRFGKVAAKFKVKNSTTIVVTTPRLKKGRYDVRVTTSGGTSTKAKSARYTVKK